MNQVAQPTMEDLLRRVQDVKDLAIADKIQGRIIYISKSEVILDIENIGLGLVRGKELYNEEYVSLLKIGETVEAVILALDNDRDMLELSFKAVGRDKIWQELTKAYEEKLVVEAKIRDVNRGGFLVKVQGVFGFLPASLLAPAHAIKQVTAIESSNLLGQMKKFVGQVFNVKILSMNPDQDSLVVSEKAVSDEIATVKLSKYKNGEIVEGTVVGIVDFGLFVRFDSDLEGLVHVSEIAWKKSDKPQADYKIGDVVKAKIVEIDQDNRINLSIKQLMENPWSKFVKTAKIGDMFHGKVSKIITHGAIITNENDVQGLLHVSQITEELLDSPSKIHDYLKINEMRDFIVLGLENEKLNLTLLPLELAQQRYTEAKKAEEIRKKELAKKETLESEVSKLEETTQDTK
jgi:small subunit ribosomal protein S1